MVSELLSKWMLFKLHLKKSTMKTTILVSMAICGSILFCSCNNDSDKATSDKDSKEVAMDQNDKKLDSTNIKSDAEWAVKAADGGMLEVQLGKLAAANASSSKVKEFAKMMVDDHTKANEELMAAAKAKNISLPAAISEKCQKKYDELSAKKGAEFDKAYIDFMVDDHGEDVDHFKKEAENGNDADLKKWAAEKLPVLQHHLDMAKSTKETIK